MNASKRHAIFSRLRQANPHPTTELEYSTPFELLVAVVLSAQSTDRGVNLATRRLFPLANTPQALYALGEAGLAESIRTLGLYKSKARHLIAACRMLIDLHDSQVPRDRAALEALPGVGRKTANVILGNAFDVPGLTVVLGKVTALAPRSWTWCRPGACPSIGLRPAAKIFAITFGSAFTTPGKFITSLRKRISRRASRRASAAPAGPAPTISASRSSGRAPPRSTSAARPLLTPSGAAIRLKKSACVRAREVRPLIRSPGAGRRRPPRRNVWRAPRAHDGPRRFSR